MLIRAATPADIAAITAIYNDAVANTVAIFNENLVDEANRLDWLEARQAAGFPVIVAVEGESVLGYASYGDWRAFSGYRHTVEHSVYVKKTVRGRGLGQALLEALLPLARAQGKHVMIAGIESGNLASIKLHQKLGFEITGQMPQVGMKFGRWLDLTFLQLILDDRAAP